MNATPTRVLMTADTVGGVWTYALELATALAARGVETVLATMGAPLSESQQVEASEVPHLKVVSSTFRLEWMAEPWADVERAGAWLLALEREWRPDVVHLNGYAHAALPFAAPKVVVAHACVSSWFHAVWKRDPPSEWERYRREVRDGLNAADAIVAPTRAMLSALHAAYGTSGGRVILHGRHSGHFRETTKEPAILAVGRLWDEAKNVASLARVARRLPWPVRIAGDVRHPNGLPDASFDNVETLGLLSRDQLVEQFARASIYAMPARYEPFGLAPLEAALSGCALILGDLESLREVWGSAATFVDAEDGDALVAAIRCLVDDPALRTHLARRAHARALELGPEPFGKAYLALYRELLQARTPVNGVG